MQMILNTDDWEYVEEAAASNGTKILGKNWEWILDLPILILFEIRQFICKVKYSVENQFPGQSRNKVLCPKLTIWWQMTACFWSHDEEI